MNMNKQLLNTQTSSTQIGENKYTLETGKLGNQADGSVWIQSGDTVVFVSAVSQKLERDIDFMPLVADYQEMSYASGKIPGSYFRREIGRPSERETLVSRLMDRPIRPLFPEGYFEEVQIIATVLSADPDFDPDVLAITGASAALQISSIPFMGPIAGGRIANNGNEFILNPTLEQINQSDINLTLAASKDAVVMVEGGAEFASEELIVDAIAWGHKQLMPLLEVQDELRETAGKPKVSFPAPEEDQELRDRIRELASESMQQALEISDKQSRKDAKSRIHEETSQKLAEENEQWGEKSKLIKKYLNELENNLVRNKIKKENTRIDGRSPDSIRELGMEVGMLPRVHGSAIFARGETKALGVATLGSSQDEQHLETLSGEQSKRFMLHYNFPPYCVGEVKMLRGPSRREIGHGALAERSLSPVLPPAEEFPFTIRIVSEIMESNGSSSMATVCAGSLALMDAGIPVKAPVAGIAMGLVQEEDDFYILTDILGDEDHLGDMDFKVAGSKEGITGIQMDIKLSGIPIEVLKNSLTKAKEARLNILDQMSTVLESPRQNLSQYAPQLKELQVDAGKIKDVIGPSGKNIKAISKATGASIDIEDNGKITVFAPNNQALQDAVEMVEYYDQKPEVGKNYVGTVKMVKDFGAIVEILPGVEGLVHISQLDFSRINNIHDFVKMGDEMRVKVTEIEKDTNKVRLSRKAVLAEDKGENWEGLDKGPNNKQNKKSSKKD